MRLVLSIVGNAVALFATTVVSGITFTGTWLQLALAGAIFGLLYFILNALLLWGFSNLLPGYAVAGFWAAFKGSLVLMVVNWLLSALFSRTKKRG
jgi:putative membrane protein